MYYDLTHTIHNDMPVYPGTPPVSISSADDEAWRVVFLKINSHAGTHIDAPYHYGPLTATTIDALPLDRFVGRGIVFHVDELGDDGEIDLQHLNPALPADARATPFALLRTGWDQYWGHDRYFRHPYLARALTRALVDAGFTLVGVDMLNVDSTVQHTSHVHELLLGREILIVENLTRLDQLEAGRVYQFSFAPLPLARADGSPIRAMAWDT